MKRMSSVLAGLTIAGLTISPLATGLSAAAAPAGPAADPSGPRAPVGSPLWQRQYEERLIDEVGPDHIDRWQAKAAQDITGQIGTPGNQRRLDWSVEELKATGL